MGFWNDIRRLIYGLRAPRIKPDQLKRRIELGERMVLVDLRNWQDVMRSGDKLPGALVTTAPDLGRELREGNIKGGLVLYCT